MSRIILASGSPRRQELMKLLHIPFEVIVADIDEKIDSNNKLSDEIEKLSFQKALAVFNNNKDAVVIGADTIVTINGQVLGKPKTEDNAFEMLKAIEGKTHEVITGVTILSNKESETFSVVSKVSFVSMSDDEIHEYIKTKEPLDKAGAYAIQGDGAKYIARIDGDYYAVMGFPISEINKRIKKYMDK